MTFVFKQFEVEHKNSPMKVGTDAVLLGALADLSKARNVLEVGTGCGVVGLMLAQRFENVNINAIDIDPHAVVEAARNFHLSNWSNRLKAERNSFQDYSYKSEEKFDHIISNPPFFHGDKLSIYPSRTKSRHTVYLSHIDFVQSAFRLSHDESEITVILPMHLAENFTLTTHAHHFFLIREIKICPKKNKPANRVVLSFSRRQRPLESSKLFVYEQNGIYSIQFQQLTEDFYL